MSEPRFYVMSLPVDARDPIETRDVAEWWAVVDEERGGIIAYFGSEDDADAYVYFRSKVTP